MQLILIFPVYLFLPHAERPQAEPAPADKHRPSMQGEVVGLGRDILQKVSVLFTEVGSTGAPWTAEPVLNLRRGDREGVAGDKPARWRAFMLVRCQR